MLRYIDTSNRYRIGSLIIDIFRCIVTAIFTARRHSFSYADGCISHGRVCPSDCPSSVTRWYCVQTNEATIMRFSPSGKTIILVSGEVKIVWKFAGDHSYRAS